MRLYKNEKRRIGAKVIPKGTEVFDITSANYELYDYTGNLIESYDAVIDDDKVYTVLDTSSDYIEKDKMYYIYFNIYIQYNAKKLIHKIDLYIAE